MNILVINHGSSSIKCALYKNETLVWEKNELPHFPIDEKVDMIGHRIVHGGSQFINSTIITSAVKKAIHKLSEISPLHNLPELEIIESMEKQFPHIPQVAVFDTAFHHTIPRIKRIYPIPYEWYEKGIQRYGFHGISYQYCTKKASEILKQQTESLKMVICHLGAGASLSAVAGNQSVDTTMGFTPLEGLMMDTRSGTIDPGIILYWLRQNMNEKEISEMLYHQSGVKGLKGRLSHEVYLHRLNSMIGSMIASLQGLDVLIFTGGIGENVPLIREQVCDHFAFLGVKIDSAKNDSNQKDLILSTPDSKAKVLVIHTQESLEIARECIKLFKNRNLL